MGASESLEKRVKILEKLMHIAIQMLVRICEDINNERLQNMPEDVRIEKLKSIKDDLYTLGNPYKNEP
jgi:hypothetical protein